MQRSAKISEDVVLNDNGAADTSGATCANDTSDATDAGDASGMQTMQAKRAMQEMQATQTMQKGECRMRDRLRSK